MYDVAGKLAVVTGGTRGIGLEISRQLLDLGANLVLNGRNPTEEAAALAAQHGAERVRIDLGNVADPDYVAGLIERADKGFGRLDMLVHSAGGPVAGTIMDLSQDAWMDAFAIHVHPVFHLFRAAQPLMARQGGAVLLVSSVAGLRGCPGSVAYQTVKGALIPLARALAFDHAAQGIRVNVVAPGIIRTRFHQKMTDAAKAHNIANRIPLRREGSAEDVASAALQMLCNDFITGEVLTVDGGMSMRVTG